MLQDGWSSPPFPAHQVIEGAYVRLEPLKAILHGDALFETSTCEDAPLRFRWLFEEPPQSRAAYEMWLEQAESSTDPLFFAVVDKVSGEAVGRQSLQRIDTEFGVIELGNVYWGPRLARSQGATEAFYLMAEYVFGLGYRRLEWKCDTRNSASRRAAERFGFSAEGIFRQHMILKRENRDTAWYAMLDGDWPRLSNAFRHWLEPANFGPDGLQTHPLQAYRRC